MFFFEHTPFCSTVSRESWLLLIDQSSSGRGKSARKREKPGGQRISHNITVPSSNGCSLCWSITMRMKYTTYSGAFTAKSYIVSAGKILKTDAVSSSRHGQFLSSMTTSSVCQFQASFWLRSGERLSEWDISEYLRKDSWFTAETFLRLA